MKNDRPAGRPQADWWLCSPAGKGAKLSGLSQPAAGRTQLLDCRGRCQKSNSIETLLVQDLKEPCRETIHLADTAPIEKVGRMETVGNWRKRRDFMVTLAKIYDRLESLIAVAHANQLSLAVLKSKSPEFRLGT